MKPYIYISVLSGLAAILLFANIKQCNPTITPPNYDSLEAVIDSLIEREQHIARQTDTIVDTIYKERAVKSYVRFETYFGVTDTLTDTLFLVDSMQLQRANEAYVRWQGCENRIWIKDSIINKKDTILVECKEYSAALEKQIKKQKRGKWIDRAVGFVGGFLIGKL